MSLNMTIQNSRTQLISDGVKWRNALYTKSSLGIQYKTSMLNISLILEISQEHMFLII